MDVLEAVVKNFNDEIILVYLNVSLNYIDWR